jgi:hypothetical protein
MPLEEETRHNTKITAPTAEGPEQVRVLAFAGGDKTAITIIVITIMVTLTVGITVGTAGTTMIDRQFESNLTESWKDLLVVTRASPFPACPCYAGRLSRC